MSAHTWNVKLDDARGGWLARCSCGWEAKRPSWYKKRAAGYAERHAAERRWGGLPLGEETPR